MSDRLDHNRLRTVTIFRDLDKNELEVVSKLVFEKSFKKGSTLFAEGMSGEVLYIVMSGCIEIIKKTKDKEVVIATLGIGNTVGEMSLIDSSPRTATGRTGEDSVLLVMTKKNFNDILESDPRIAAKILMAMLKIVNTRLRMTDKKFEER